MASSFDGFCTALEEELDDSTVQFLTGKAGREHGRRDQSRRVSLVRESGRVGFSTARGRRFVREDTIRMTVAAVDEEAVDLLFNRLLNAIFAISGPDAFEMSNNYAWGAEDSKGGGHLVRQPVLIFALVLRFGVPTPAELTAELEAAEGTVTELGVSELVVTPAA